MKLRKINESWYPQPDDYYLVWLRVSFLVVDIYSHLDSAGAQATREWTKP